MTAVRFPHPAFALLAACLATVPPAPAHAAAPDPARAVPPRRAFSFTPHSGARCAVFAITEAGGHRATIGAQDFVDRTVYTNAIGLMANVGPRWAVGGSEDLMLVKGDLYAVPTARLRCWLPREQSVEAAIGLPAGAPDRRLGPVASLRYSPLPQFFVQAGVTTLRDVEWVQERGEPFGHYALVDRTIGYGGAGFAGPPAVAVFGIEAAVFGVLIALFAGME